MCYLVSLLSYLVSKAFNVNNEKMVPEIACILHNQIGCTGGGSRFCWRTLRSVTIGTPCDGPNSDTIVYVCTLPYTLRCPFYQTVFHCEYVLYV